MAIESQNADGTKKRVVVYFDPELSDIAKDFGGRMRITDRVECTLVWAKKFIDETSVRFGVGAIVLQEGCTNEDLIRETYERVSPDTEIHYMTDEGLWVEDEDAAVETDATGNQEPDQSGVTPVQAETDFTNAAPTELESGYTGPASGTTVADDDSVQSTFTSEAGDGADGESEV